MLNEAVFLTGFTLRTKKSDIGAVRRTRAKDRRWRRVVVTLRKPDVLDHCGKVRRILKLKSLKILWA